MPSRSKRKQIHRELVSKEKEDVIKSLEPKDAEMILEELPDETRVQMLQHISYEQMMYSGPIPPASEMAEYNNVIPNGGDRIMKMAENQSEHRQHIEKLVINSKNRDSLLGVIFGGVIGVLGIVLGFFLIQSGHKFAGSAFAGGPLVALVSLYLRGTYLDQKDLEEKRKND